MTGIFAGKVALITGGSRGIGQAIAEALAASGAFVVFTHYGEAQLAQAVVEGIERRGGAALTLEAFLGPPGSAEALASRALEEIRGKTGEALIDILVNNFGSAGYGRVPDTTDEYFDEVFAKNVRVPYFLVKALMSHIRPGGSVVNLSSAAARLVNPDFQVYSLAKAAQQKFTQVLAREFGPLGVRVNSVAPGMIDTEVNRPFLSDPAYVQALQADTALGRIGQPQDIADVVHALCSPAFRFVTGQVIEASGGFKM
jgi:NAD(P)-dependent dehydrogenase (short-subunit alcohol dehydrogenase family)